MKLGIVNLASQRRYLPQTKNRRDHMIHLGGFAVAPLRLFAEMREAADGAGKAVSVPRLLRAMRRTPKPH